MNTQEIVFWKGWEAFERGEPLEPPYQKYTTAKYGGWGRPHGHGQRTNWAYWKWRQGWLGAEENKRTGSVKQNGL